MRVGQNGNHADRSIAVNCVRIHGIHRPVVIGQAQIGVQSSADFSGSFYHGKSSVQYRGQPRIYIFRFFSILSCFFDFVKQTSVLSGVNIMNRV